MSNCCTSEQSAASCATAQTNNIALSQCAACGTEGRPVERQTTLHHIKHEYLDQIGYEAYRFCPDLNCEIVYFGDGGTRFTINELRELVTVKMTGDARPICYCFGFTEGDARKEIELTGRSGIPEQISLLIKAGMCACEIRNPASVCCLGEVNRTVKRLVASRPAETRTGARP